VPPVNWLGEWMAAFENAHAASIIRSKPEGEVWISLEFFPPKTEKGVAHLYHMIETKLKDLNPVFVDFTWGAGGSTSDLTLDLCVQSKQRYNLNPNMHLTCTNMEEQKVHDALAGCYAAGITNIVALRGDPPAGQEAWKAVDESFTCALDLILFIRKEYGDKFCIAASGYPEGHPNSMTRVEDTSALSPSELGRVAKVVNEDGTEELYVCLDADYAKELTYLKQKVDAGANLIITQLFFDVDVFLTFMRDCRDLGITIPIVPGIMCVANHHGFLRMTKFCKTRVPEALRSEVIGCVDEDSVKELGIRWGTEMCQKLLENGLSGLHFYTLNLSHVTLGIIENLKASGVQFYIPPPLPRVDSTSTTAESETLSS
jgi:methylenetetrahydrofolate reductase (NADPH)